MLSRLFGLLPVASALVFACTAALIRLLPLDLPPGPEWASTDRVDTREFLTVDIRPSLVRASAPYVWFDGRVSLEDARRAAEMDSCVFPAAAPEDTGPLPSFEQVAIQNRADVLHSTSPAMNMKQLAPR